MDITIRLNEVPIEFKDIPAITSGDKILIQEKGIKALLKQLMKLHDRYVGKTKIDYKYKNRSLNIYIESTIVPDTQKKDIFEKAIYDIFAYSTKDELSGLKFRWEWKEGQVIDWSGIQINWGKRPVGKPRGASVAKKKQEAPEIPASPSPVPPPATQSERKPKMRQAWIDSAEGSAKFNGVLFDTWEDFQRAFKTIYDKWAEEGEGYFKVKIDIDWELQRLNDTGQLVNMRLLDRVDVGDGQGDFNPYKEFIGDYLKKQESAMYTSTFDAKGFPYDRDSVSWTDEPETKPQETKTTKMARILTEAEFKQSYGDDWRDQLDWVDDMDNVFGQELSETELSYMMKGADVEIVGGDGNNYFVNLRMTTKNLSKKYEGYSEEDLHKLLTGLVLLADDFGSTTARQEVKALVVYMGNNKF